MAELRSQGQRKADVQATLGKNGDLWIATADKAGHPHLIAASAWWDGRRIVIATRERSATARNLQATRVARLGLGSPDDVIMVDAALDESTPVSKAKPELKQGFIDAVGWDPAEEGDDWAFFGLRPVQIQAYRGYGELKGRVVMRDSSWLP